MSVHRTQYTNEPINSGFIAAICDVHGAISHWFYCGPVVPAADQCAWLARCVGASMDTRDYQSFSKGLAMDNKGVWCAMVIYKPDEYPLAVQRFTRRTGRAAPKQARVSTKAPGWLSALLKEKQLEVTIDPEIWAPCECWLM